MNCTTYVAKTKALISFAVTGKLICVFVFACAKCWFSPDTAHFIFGTNHWVILLSRGATYDDFSGQFFSYS